LASESAPDSHASASVKSAGSAGSSPGVEVEERRYIRVATKRLDTLINLAGELVVNRSRLVGRVTTLRLLQAELGRSRQRFEQSVEAFRNKYEFALLDGNALPMQVVRRIQPAAPASLSLAGAGGGAFDDQFGTSAPDLAFGALEMDRYEDVHILSRTLGEIGGDFGEIFGRMTRELSSFADDSEAFGTIVSGIQEEVTRARMVPLELLFNRLRLPVRDAAERESKDVQVVVRGADVTLDKTIADALFAPMLHLVRNAVVHGIERTDRREEIGKARTGVIVLEARQESGQIVLEVSDDGTGLDLEALRQKGISLGLITPEVAATDAVVRDLVFAAGLSTKEGAGAVAGRGVGGDIVRRSVERLSGDVRVETTTGKGTRFVITLPLTLAITRALLVQHRSRAYAIPLFFADRIIDPEAATIVESAGARRVKVGDEYTILRHLDEIFGNPDQGARSNGPILILRLGEQRIALQVDRVAEQEEVVVKNMGDLLSGHPLFAGVTIRGSGELVLIIDVAGLVETQGGTTRTRGRGPAPTPTDDTAGVAVPAELEEELGEEPHSEARALRVLFVDDSLSVRKVAEQMLHELGADVTVAVDGVDGFAKLREGTFDMVFTDLEMPRMHGYDFIREMRFVPAYRNLPVVVVTSRSGQKHQDQATAVGANGYITKPFSAKSLEEMLERWGRRR